MKKWGINGIVQESRFYRANDFYFCPGKEKIPNENDDENEYPDAGLIFKVRANERDASLLAILQRVLPNLKRCLIFKFQLLSLARAKMKLFYSLLLPHLRRVQNAERLFENCRPTIILFYKEIFSNLYRLFLSSL